MVLSEIPGFDDFLSGVEDFAEDPVSETLGFPTFNTPSGWSCDGDRKRVRVEVRPNNVGGRLAGWEEIPTSKVQSWTRNPGGQMFKRVAKVTFPSPWDGKSVREFLEPYTPQGDAGVYLQGRVSFRQSPEDNWTVQHLGFVSGFSGTDSPKEGKFWIYDFSEMFEGISFQAHYDSETTFDSLLTGDGSVGSTVVNSPVPASSVVFNDLTAEELKSEDLPFTTRVYPEEIVEGTISDGIKDDRAITLILLSKNEEDLEGEGRKPFSQTALRYKDNRHTVFDALTDIASFSGAQWWLEPTPDGEFLTLYFDVARDDTRTYVQDVAFDNFDGGNGFVQRLDPGGVIENNALADVNPITTVEVLGKTTTKEKYQGSGASSVSLSTPIIGLSQIPIKGSSTNTSKGYVYGVASADPLIQASNGQAVKKNIHSDDTSEDAAIERAVEELKKRVNREGEGEIRLRGIPELLPGDSIVAFETCGELYEGREIPVTYSVESVKHVQEEGDVYETVATCTLDIDSDEITTDGGFEVTQSGGT